MAGLEGTVKAPVFGTIQKKTAVYGSVGAVVLVLGIWWYRQRKHAQAASAAATAAPGGQQTDPAGNTGTIDPATGYVYGSAEDQQALAAAQGPGGFNTTGLGAGLTGYYYGGGGAVPTTAPGPGNFADNAEWAQYAENYMITTLNADPAAVGNALGKYITGQPVDPGSRAIIDEAIAIAGLPPVPGPGGDPPGIKTAGTPGPKPPPPSPKPPPAAGKVTVPDLVGDRVENATSALHALGLKASFGHRKPDTPYIVTATSPRAGARVARDSTVHLIIAPAPAPGQKNPLPGHHRA